MSTISPRIGSAFLATAGAVALAGCSSNADAPAAPVEASPTETAQKCLDKPAAGNQLQAEIKSVDPLEVIVNLAQDVDVEFRGSPASVKGGVLSIKNGDGEIAALALVSGAIFVDDKPKGRLGGLNASALSVDADDKGIFGGIDTAEVLKAAQDCVSGQAPKDAPKDAMVPAGPAPV